MTDALTFLLPALAMCLVIASIHVYLGMHILEREVIFVDLSLAQLAALGAMVVALLGGHEPGLWTQAGAFAFTVCGAAIFALTGRRRSQVSQEAVVGVVYAVASALMILVLSQAPHGAEQIKDALVGSLLLTTWQQVAKAVAVYVVLGIVHVIFARRFLRISWDRDEAERTMAHVAWWDFGFYLLFGIVITISVQVAGVLVVFSYLIVPAVITKLFSRRVLARLVAGWLLAVFASLVGLSASWQWDLPTGATVVAAFGVILVVAGAVTWFSPAKWKPTRPSQVDSR